MNILGIHFHKWKDIGYNKEYTFEGGTCFNFISEYRKCIECDKIQNYNFDSQGGRWHALSKCESNIINDCIKNGKYFIKE